MVSIVASRHLLLEVPHQRDLELRPLVAPQRIRHDRRRHRRLDLHHPKTRTTTTAVSSPLASIKDPRTHHLKRPANDTFQHLGVHQSALDRLLREFHKVRQGVLVENEGEGGLGLCRRDGVLYEARGDGEEGPERDLGSTRGQPEPFFGG